MKDNRAVCIRISGGWEGGYSDHPADRGGETYRGVIISVWRAYLTRKGLPFRAITTMTEEEYQDILVSQYWHPVHGDVLPYGVDLSTFDYGLNSGPRQSIKDLQRVVGAKADGIIGNMTLQAVEQASLTPEATASVVRAHCERRGGLYNWIISRNPSQVVFKRGWFNRLADIEVKGVDMALNLTEQRATDEAESADQRATTNANKAGGAVLGGGTVDAVVTTSAEPSLWVWLLIIAIAIATGLAVWRFLHKRSYQKVRSAAYYKAAQEIALSTEVADALIPAS